mgnify:CR=1 FL=1
MADKKRRNTPNTGNKRNNGRRKKKGRLKGLIAAELIVVVVLVMIVGHNLGLGTGITNFVNSIRKPAVEELDITGINSPYAVLMNAKSGKVIGDINGEEQMYPASMTKIMTTILAIENLKDLNQEITITNDMVADLYVQDAMQAGFQPNETVKAIDLLYGVMLPSGAECCVALADTVAGSVSDFVTIMNEKAEKLGMTGTHFSSISGLHREDHYSTAKDIALLLRYAIKNDTFREITFYSTMFKNLSDTSVIDGEIKGGKTGYTSQAGHCLASFAEIDGVEYILVTAGAPGTGNPHIDDAVKLYNRLGESSSVLYGR